ncbi:MAG: DUF1707 SHOCT-like domain-containing protein [Streptosporangiaceae bacterium]
MRNDPMVMRASDHDRQQVVDRLRAGLEVGRLTMEEYVDRMGHALQAVTYADLAPLHADLPAVARVAERPGPPRPVRAAAAPGGVLAGLPTALKVLWTVWLAAVSINVVVWALVSATHGHLAYPWPVWVAGPYGALLAAISVGVRQARPAVRME